MPGLQRAYQRWRDLAGDSNPVGSLDPASHLLDYEAAFLFTMAVADAALTATSAPLFGGCMKASLFLALERRPW